MRFLITESTDSLRSRLLRKGVGLRVAAFAFSWAAPLAGATQGESATLISVNTFGARPDSGEDALPAFQRAIAAAAEAKKPCVIQLDPGRYDLFRAQATRQLYHVSNTASETEVPDPTKTIALLLRDLHGVTLDGQGALLLLHGEMTGFVIDKCSDLEVKNLRFDMADPSVAEVKVIKVAHNTVLYEAVPGTRFRMDGKQIVFQGDAWEFTHGIAQGYDPQRDVTWRSPNPLEGDRVEVIGAHRFRVTSPKMPLPLVGQSYQFRDAIRDQVGGFIYGSRNITFTKVTMHFMHGFGIVGQTSENLIFDRLICEPRPETNRMCAGFADFMQFSGCRGKITVTNSRFNGAQDDLINIHGTHLRIMAQPAPDQIVVRFMHAQTYGFEAFFPEDEIEFIRMDTLVPFGSAKVRAAEVLSPRDTRLTLDRTLPDGILLNQDVVENVTWTPEVEISHSYFGRTPTRGLLITTRRKVTIEHNTFHRTTGPAILIADDAKSWFESGMVRNLTIHNNTFFECGEPVILIAPESTGSDEDHFVHRNVRIERNEFRLLDHVALSAYATRDLRFIGNKIDPQKPGAPVLAVQCPNLSVDVDVKRP